MNTTVDTVVDSWRVTQSKYLWWASAPGSVWSKTAKNFSVFKSIKVLDEILCGSAVVGNAQHAYKFELSECLNDQAVPAPVVSRPPLLVNVLRNYVLKHGDLCLNLFQP